MHISRFKLIPVFPFMVLALCLFSCKQAKEQPPVPESKMEAVLLDLHLAESYSQGLGEDIKNKFEKNYDTLPAFYLTVLKHYDLSFEAFNEALQWYKKHPIQLDSLYQDIINRFNELKASEGIKDIEEAATAEVPQVPEALKEKPAQKDTLMDKKDTTVMPKNKKEIPKPVINVAP